MANDNVRLGKNVVILHEELVNLYGCIVGDGTKIGAFVEVQKGVRIGKNCKISSHCFICQGVTIEDEVFIGHGVVFTNDRYPRATNKRGGLQKESDWWSKDSATLVKQKASIGSNSTVLCGLTIGKASIIGAGSVVTKNVPPGVIVAGNPARILRKIDK